MKDRTWEARTRLGGLRRFALAITVLTVLGHTYLGFETSFAQPVVALCTAYSCELFLRWVDARVQGRSFSVLERGSVDSLLPTHITALAIAMLLYPGDRLMPVVFASVVAICSKTLLRCEVGGSSRHVFNPSNLGITATLLAFPSVGIAAPYQFTENLDALGDWLLPAAIVASGSFLNARFTRRWPLITAWLVGFVAQAGIRHWFLGSSLEAALMPMSGLAFLLFTFYMVTDPPTTPSGVRGQVVFGAGVAALYGGLMALHVVFGLFFALTIACSVRLLALMLLPSRSHEELIERDIPSRIPSHSTSVARSRQAGEHARV